MSIINSTIRDARPSQFDKLSAEDQQAYAFDLMAYGCAFIRVNDDGTCAHVPVEQIEPWLRVS